ncbi:MAG: DUF2975 domain-containing protein [Candidatus Krumholzibacteriia bacterium]
MRVSNLSSLTGLVKVVIYLAFIGALLAFVYVLGSFIYVMSNADDLGKVNVTTMRELPALAKGLSPDVWESENGAARFRLRELYGQFSFLSMPRTLVLAIFFKELVLCGLFFIGIVQMANMFEDVSRGKPFARENAARLRIVGYAMAGGVLFNFLVRTGILILFRRELAISGAENQLLQFSTDSPSWGLLAGGLIVLVISEVFRLGNKLQEEQELTV